MKSDRLKTLMEGRQSKSWKFYEHRVNTLPGMQPSVCSMNTEHNWNGATASSSLHCQREGMSLKDKNGWSDLTISQVYMQSVHLGHICDMKHDKLTEFW